MVQFSAGVQQGAKRLRFSRPVHLCLFPDCGTRLTLRGSMASWVSVARTPCTAIAMLWPGLHQRCGHPQPMAQSASFWVVKLSCPGCWQWSLPKCYVDTARERGRRRYRQLKAAACRQKFCLRANSWSDMWSRGALVCERDGCIGWWALPLPPLRTHGAERCVC